MEIITKIINDWDHLGFFPMAPKDEYVNEINKIYKYVYLNQSVQSQILAEEINKIFLETFGEDVYDGDIDQCILVAERILDEMISWHNTVL